jgi:hypothetical protein
MAVQRDELGRSFCDVCLAFMAPYGHGCECRPPAPPEVARKDPRPAAPKAPEPEPKPERTREPKIYTPTSGPTPNPVVVLLGEIRDLLKILVKDG